MFFIMALVVIGASAGWAASLIYGKQYKVSGTELFLIGIVGSFTGGLVLNLLLGNGIEIHMTGIIGSVGGAVIALPVYVWIRSAFRKRSA